MRRTLHLLVVLMLMVAGTAVAGAAPAGDPVGSYIVVLHPGGGDVPGRAAALASAHGGRLGYVYEHALEGFSVELGAAAAEALARNPSVAYVEADLLRSVAAQATPTGIERTFADDNTGLDIDGSDDYRVDVDVAVIDTGIDWEHPDLNVVGGINCASGTPFRASCRGNGDDDHYHGTHVAGTVGAIDNGLGVVGVAPGARLWAVKVLNSQGSGYASWIIAGIDWVTARASTIEVANMSLGGSGFLQSEYDAIQRAVNAGVAFAVSAGNSDADAGGFSPGGFNNVLSVSALADFDGAAGGFGAPTCRIDQDDTLADFSNWGSAVDIAAPGVCILSTYPLERGEYGTISGTSMASPHVAGALAILASRNNPGNASAVNNLYDQVKGAGNSNWTDDSGDGVKEPLLDLSNATLFAPVLVAGSGGGGGTVDAPPTVSITSPTANSTVSGSVTVSAHASDDNAVTSVEFRVDGALVGTDSNGADGWTVSWDTTAVADGAHTLTAVATDSVGQSTTSASVSVTVDNVADALSLTVTAYKLKGQRYADLSWSGGSGSFDVFRDGMEIGTTSGFTYTDGPLGKGGGTATYQVCEDKTPATCSNSVTVGW